MARSEQRELEKLRRAQGEHDDSLGFFGRQAGKFGNYIDNENAKLDRLSAYARENIEPGLTAAARGFKDVADKTGGIFKSGVEYLGGGDFDSGLSSIQDFAKRRGLDAYHAAELATSANLGKPETSVSQTSIGYDPLAVREGFKAQQLAAAERDKSDRIRDSIFGPLSDQLAARTQKAGQAVDTKTKQSDAYADNLTKLVFGSK
jgi:hypothetical protein